MTVFTYPGADESTEKVKSYVGVICHTPSASSLPKSGYEFSHFLLAHSRGKSVLLYAFR
ncbi:hypothetical protein [Bacteroides graminisolvens]